jgi:hypothetical protein
MKSSGKLKKPPNIDLKKKKPLGIEQGLVNFAGYLGILMHVEASESVIQILSSR